MEINGHRLPDSYLRAVASGAMRRERGSWQLLSDRDASGQHLETELAVLYETLTQIERATAGLPVGFEPDGMDGQSIPEMTGPGAIPGIADFGRVVCFGTSGDGSPFCFDYHAQNGEPRVIWWDDVYWRIVAPDFASFLSLFDLPT